MTAGIYCIRNTSNDRVYIGSSRNIENRFQTHFESLRLSNHHSWKLQEDWITFGEKSFVTEILHTFEISNPHLELQLEIFERTEVLVRNALSHGYNVSDEIIRDTSLVLKFCDEALDTYIRENEEKFAKAKRGASKTNGFFGRLIHRTIFGSQEKKGKDFLDVESHASDYLRENLVKLFLDSGLDEASGSMLADGYVVDVGKMRGEGFRYWGRGEK